MNEKIQYTVEDLQQMPKNQRNEILKSIPVERCITIVPERIRIPIRIRFPIKI